MTHPFQMVPRGVDATSVIKNHAEKRGITFERAQIEIKALFGTPPEKKEDPGKAHFLGGGVDEASNHKGYTSPYNMNTAAQYAGKPQSSAGATLSFKA